MGRALIKVTPTFLPPCLLLFQVQSKLKKVRKNRVSENPSQNDIDMVCHHFLDKFQAFVCKCNHGLLFFRSSISRILARENESKK